MESDSVSESRAQVVILDSDIGSMLTDQDRDTFKELGVHVVGSSNSSNSSSQSEHDELNKLTRLIVSQSEDKKKIEREKLKKLLDEDKPRREELRRLKREKRKSNKSFIQQNLISSTPRDQFLSKLAELRSRGIILSPNEVNKMKVEYGLK